MVNTFVTFCDGSEPDYSTCAKNLDSSRLWKQCLEATQILNILEGLALIAKHFGWDPCPLGNPTNPQEIAKLFLERAQWVKDIRKKYLSQPIRLVNYRGTLREMTKVPPKIRTGDRYKIEGKLVQVWRKGSFRKPPVVYNVKDVLLPSDKAHTLGFSSHPIVRMWVGYEDSLKLYINAHLKEHLSRPTKSGKPRKSSIQPHIVDKPVLHPWWVTCEEVLFTHRASLYRKGGPPSDREWYSKPDFSTLPSEWYNHGYIWTCNLSHNQIVSLLSGDISLDEYCAPLSN